LTLLPVLLALLLWGSTPANSGQQLAGLLRARSGTVRLPPGIVEISSEIRLPENAHNLEITGSGTTLRAAANFHGRAMLSCKDCRGLHLRSLTIDGNRRNLEHPMAIPASNRTFADTYDDIGLLLEGGDGLSISSLRMRNMASFAILVSAARDVTVEDVTVESSGGHNALGRNNTSGGILLEEGVARWTIAHCQLRAIAGNAVWTHSRFGSPKNVHGVIAGNSFETIGRDAIQVGEASDVRVTSNTGRSIGWPVAEIDVESRAVPVAIDTAGNVDTSRYENNRFEEIDGKCIDLDGFHDGAVRHNTCVNRRRVEDYPWGQYGMVMNNSAIDMQPRNIIIEGNVIDGSKYGGIFIIGDANRVLNNKLLHLNVAHCSDGKPGCVVAGSPGLLTAGIYLGGGGSRPAPARGNIIERNDIAGWNMGSHCIAYAPGVKPAENTVRGNRCEADE